MANRLVNLTQLCCNQLNDTSMNLSDLKGVCVIYNDNYYQTALDLVGAEYQGQGALAFLQEVNTDINAHRTIQDGVGHVESGLITLGETIGNTSYHYDGLLNRITLTPPPAEPIGRTFYASGTFEGWRDYLIENTLSSPSFLDDALTSGAIGVKSSYDAVKQTVSTSVQQYIDGYPAAVESLTANDPVANEHSEGYQLQYNPNAIPAFNQYCFSAFSDMAALVWQYLSAWADSLQHGVTTLQQTIQSAESYLSARDLYDFIYNNIDGPQSTNKPITITPYTTKDGKKGLLITVAGTDLTHSWDTSWMVAGQTGLGDPNSRYEKDLQNAIAQYMAEHPDMKGAQITFAGYSLGGMTAQVLVNSHKDFLQQQGLDTTHITMITYGSPVMGPPQQGVNYTMYDATYDPIPLLSSYENPGVFVAPLLGIGLGADEYAMPWNTKLHTYIDPKGQYGSHIFNISDVGSTILPGKGPSIFQNHLEYYQSDQLNGPQTAVTTIDPNSLGPTEYFGMSNPGTN